ncbi:hypothetical protein SAMN05443377_1262 [Propionibacterium cyclohexanicum]|uniref:Uncharacterized protein n=1 Tax=Propionibacterium cyclohexanicum TaxID=64702 RepID=A0A1H9TNR5_9ACTN|nr:hypothetical protein [Propionibacterium cyclohexanicum]SER98772.1 hypothetical protein SAMN05443377_1262 [Propionibacterium cyclohexanicum]
MHDIPAFMNHSLSRRGILSGTAALAALLTVSACGTGGSQDSASASASATAGGATDAFPVTIDGSSQMRV